MKNKTEKVRAAAISATTTALMSKEDCIIAGKRSLSSQNRIAKRRSDIPKVYRGIYDKALTGKSLRAAVNAFCLECVCWQREEVRLCPSTPCPLWLYRPYREDTVKTDKANPCSKTPSDGPDSALESSNGSNS